MSLIAHIRIFCSIFLLYSKIRKFRPPGNFASIQLDHYTAAKIPLGVGVRFFVRKMVERLYMDAAMSKSEVHSKELASDGSFSGGVKTISSFLMYIVNRKQILSCWIAICDIFVVTFVKSMIMPFNRMH